MLNIVLSDRILAFVEEQATAAGLNTASEYVYQLILREQERLLQQKRVESLLLEGLVAHQLKQQMIGGNKSEPNWLNTFNNQMHYR